MKKLLLLGIIGFMGLSIEASERAPIPQDIDKKLFADNIKEALRSNEQEFGNLFKRIKEQYVVHGHNVDEMDIKLGLVDYKLGSLINDALTGKVAALKGASHSKQHARMIAAHVYDKRSHKMPSQAPNRLFKGLIDDVLAKKASVGELQRFFEEGRYSLLTPIEDRDDDFSIKDHIVRLATYPGEAQDIAREICGVLKISLESLPEAASSSSSPESSAERRFVTLLSNAFTSNKAYREFKGCYEQGDFDVDSIVFGDGQMVGVLLDRSSGLPDPYDALMELVEEKRSHSTSREEEEQNKLFNMIFDALDAETTEKFVENFALLQDYYKKGNYNVDMIAYDLIIDHDSKQLCLRSLGKMLDDEGKTLDPQALLILTLVYDNRTFKDELSESHQSPDQFLGRLAIKAMLMKQKDDFNDFRCFYTHSPIKFDVDCVIKSVINDEPKILGNLLSEGLRSPTISQNSFNILKVVQEGRSDKDIVLNELIKYQQTRPARFRPLVIDWVSSFNLSGERLITDSSGKKISLKDQFAQWKLPFPQSKSSTQDKKSSHVSQSQVSNSGSSTSSSAPPIKAIDKASNGQSFVVPSSSRTENRKTAAPQAKPVHISQKNNVGSIDRIEKGGLKAYLTPRTIFITLSIVGLSLFAYKKFMSRGQEKVKAGGYEVQAVY